MKKQAVWVMLGASLVWLASLPALASPTPMFNECPAVGQDTGCAVLITINSGGSLAYQVDPNQAPSFNPAEADTLVGVLNNSGALTYSITISGNGIFALDGNGACSGGYAVNPPLCPDPFNAVTTYEGYDKDNQNFDALAFGPPFNSGTVQFFGGLSQGDSAFFSLEGAPTDINGVTVTPEPASVLLLGTGLLGLALMLRKFSFTV